MSSSVDKARGGRGWGIEFVYLKYSFSLITLIFVSGRLGNCEFYKFDLKTGILKTYLYVWVVMLIIRKLMR